MVLIIWYRGIKSQLGHFIRESTFENVGSEASSNEGRVEGRKWKLGQGNSKFMWMPLGVERRSKGAKRCRALLNA